MVRNTSNELARAHTHTEGPSDGGLRSTLSWHSQNDVCISFSIHATVQDKPFGPTQPEWGYFWDKSCQEDSVARRRAHVWNGLWPVSTQLQKLPALGSSERTSMIHAAHKPSGRLNRDGEETCTIHRNHISWHMACLYLIFTYQIVLIKSGAQILQ